MDNALLIPVVDELRSQIVGSTLSDFIQFDSRRFALRFSSPPFPRLLVVLHPDLSALHLSRRAPASGQPTQLSAAVTAGIGGALLTAVDKDPRDRVVEMRFRKPGGGGGILVLELLGKASNLLLLDPDRVIRCFARSHHGTFRQPKEGDAYVPPPPRPPAQEELPAGSRLLEEELRERVRRGEGRREALRDLVERMEEARWEFSLYAPRPPEEIGETEELPPPRCFPAPFALAIGETLHRSIYPTANEAVAAHAALLLRHLAWRDRQGGLLSLVKGEQQRTARLLEALAREEAAARGSEEVRRRGDLILASLSTAVKRGGAVDLVDVFDGEMPQVTLEIDPKLDLKENADLFYRRARKMDRAARAIAGRLASGRRKLEALAGFEDRLAAATSDDLERLERELAASGLVKVVRRPERPEIGRKPSYVRVREYRTSDGHTVLVGRSGAENDTLTFKVAAPHDFWFHAAGRPGAHVVVRNPKRSRDLPEAAVREAAAIAAYFSRGDRGGEVEVHWTQRKEVRKGKGMAPGMVHLRRFRSTSVTPALPAGSSQEETG